MRKFSFTYAVLDFPLILTLTGEHNFNKSLIKEKPLMVIHQPSRARIL